MYVTHGSLFDTEDAILIDGVAQGSEVRRELLRRAFRGSGETLPIVRASPTEDAPLLGYAMLEYSFFDNGFMPLVYVAPEYRRRGLAGQLIAFIENLCQRPKLFSSTNLSNAPMHALFARLGYSACGMVTALDENDPEVFYVKRVKP